MQVRLSLLPGGEEVVTGRPNRLHFLPPFPEHGPAV